MVRPNDGHVETGDVIDGMPVVYVYTRAMALADGVLVDFGKEPLATICRQAGIRHPVAMTSTAWAASVGEGPYPDGQSLNGRAWDVLCVARAAMGRAARQEPPTDRADFKVRVWNGKRFNVVEMWIHCGPGDDAEPVLTIMLQRED